MQRLSGHVLCRVAGQVGDGFGDVFDGAGVAERDALVRCLPFGVGILAANFGGFDASWGDRVDSYSFGREFERERSGETEDTGFGGGVSDDALAVGIPISSFLFSHLSAAGLSVSVSGRWSGIRSAICLIDSE